MSSDFAVTKAASKMILELGMNGGGGASRLRIKVEGGGCSGFKYIYEFSDVIESEDLIFQGEGGAEVIIDNLSINLIKNSVLDYAENLGEAGFEIKNPQATAKCGCGNSFAV